MIGDVIKHSFAVLFLAGLTLLAPLPPEPPPPQTAPSSSISFFAEPQPLDAPLAWKQLVGIYHYDDSKQDLIIGERNQHLFYQFGSMAPPVEITAKDDQVWLNGRDGRLHAFSVRRDSTGTVTELTHLAEHYSRADAGTNRYFHIGLKQPIKQLRSAALAAKPPAETGTFRTPDLIELTSLDPAFHLDIRYAQSDNFLSTPIYTQARAFLQRPAAEALLRVLHKLQPLAYGLIIHDAYRPWYVTKIFWDATPPADHMFVADPQKGSRHNRGCAVDLTLRDLVSGRPVEMPSLYDEMSPRSFPDFPGGTSLQRWHRDLLRRAMESEGFTVNEDEWWHFDYKDWKEYAIHNVPFENLSGVSTQR